MRNEAIYVEDKRMWGSSYVILRTSIFHLRSMKAFN